MTPAEAMAQGFGTLPIHGHGFYDFVHIDTGETHTRWCVGLAGQVFVTHSRGSPWLRLDVDSDGSTRWMWRGPVRAPGGI